MYQIFDQVMNRGKIGKIADVDLKWGSGFWNRAAPPGISGHDVSEYVFIICRNKQVEM